MYKWSSQCQKMRAGIRATQGQLCLGGGGAYGVFPVRRGRATTLLVIYEATVPKNKK